MAVSRRPIRSLAKAASALLAGQFTRQGARTEETTDEPADCSPSGPHAKLGSVRLAPLWGASGHRSSQPICEYTVAAISTRSSVPFDSMAGSLGERTQRIVMLLDERCLQHDDQTVPSRAGAILHNWHIELARRGQ